MPKCSGRCVISFNRLWFSLLWNVLSRNYMVETKERRRCPWDCKKKDYKLLGLGRNIYTSHFVMKRLHTCILEEDWLIHFCSIFPGDRSFKKKVSAAQLIINHTDDVDKCRWVILASLSGDFLRSSHARLPHRRIKSSTVRFLGQNSCTVCDFGS